MNLYIRDGEFITFLGPSGCGKTTTLRIIGGFETADEGSLFFDGVEISDVPAYKRHINTVFQKYALFPPFEKNRGGRYKKTRNRSAQDGCVIRI